VKSKIIIKKNRDNSLFKRKLNQKKKHQKRILKKIFEIKTSKYFNTKIEKELDNDFSFDNIISKWLSDTLKLLIFNKDSQFHLESIKKSAIACKGKFIVPTEFSIITKPDESYEFIKSIFGSLLYQLYDNVLFDYSNCTNIELGTQCLLDIIQKDILIFYKKCEKHYLTRPNTKRIGGININNDNIKKMLFSVGSPAIHSNNSLNFKDVIKYPLCIFDSNNNLSSSRKEMQKEVDTTNLVEYVLECLKRFNKTLTSEKIEDLSIVISEILINAEEHSSTNIRYSIGYLQEYNNTNEHYGVFNLCIFNFGDTIYNKFKSPLCPNQDIVESMNKLSDSYKSKRWFLKDEFEEETLWTLYALQEGVTTVPKDKYIKRGNGSIQFIEKFLSFKGEAISNKSSNLTILSGKSKIMFDGTYRLSRGFNSYNEPCTYMTFNKSGNILEKPDKDFVKFVKNNFPGTMISASILFNDDDFLKNETE
jgi:hypothetical protein